MKAITACTFLLILVGCAQGQGRAPVIDMHLHALTGMAGTPSRPLCVPMITYVPALDPNQSWDGWLPIPPREAPCANPIWSGETDEAVMEETIDILQRRNIIGVLSGRLETVERWKDVAPERFIPALAFDLVNDSAITPDAVRNLVETGRIEVFGEIGNQYLGIAPNDERMDPYWDIAEELDLPVAIHMGEGRPGGAYIGDPEYRVRLGSPLLLEEVLVRHPALRIYVMHYGSPLIEEMIALMQAYPQVYVELGGIQWLYPREYFYRQLQQFIDAGFGTRVMFGSDQMIWPGVIEPAIAIIEEARFLGEREKRDILYNNAARFLRLSDDEIERHHGM